MPALTGLLWPSWMSLTGVIRTGSTRAAAELQCASTTAGCVCCSNVPAVKSVLVPGRACLVTY